MASSKSGECWELFGCGGGNCHSCAHSYNKRQQKPDEDKTAFHADRKEYHREWARTHRKQRSEAQARWREKKRREKNGGGSLPA